MNDGVSVTGSTVLRRSLEGVVAVTGLALDLHVLAGQLERRQVVVERTLRDVGPGVRRVALGTVGPEAPLVNDRVGVARSTIFGRALKGVVDVAGLALDLHMLAGQ